MRAKAYTRGLPMLPALASLTPFAAAISAATSPSPVVGHVYVNAGNTSGGNTIGAFDRHADGTLTPIPGSPYLAGGFGSPATTLSQGTLQRRSDSRYLLAVDRGNNQTSVLRIKRDGPDSPTPGPAGAQPIGIVVT